MSMNKERLKKLNRLHLEVEHLQSQIDDMICMPLGYVSDTASDYRSGFKHTIKISGYGDADYVDKKATLYKRLNAKIVELETEILELEDFLDGVEDAELRTIFRMIYSQGMTHEEVAWELGYSREAISKKLDRFWKRK